MAERTLLIGVDGGGTKTAARVAEVAADGTIAELGEGFGGPSNVRAVGPAHAEVNLEVAIDAAHRAAGTEGQQVACAVLGLAGSSLEDVATHITSWASRSGIAERVELVSDAELVRAAGLGDEPGIALIVGTGSVAIGTDEAGETSMTGGWGHWFGDLGSGFDLGRRALSAVADAVDGIGDDTVLVERVLDRLLTDEPREILQRLGLRHDIRREIAGIAPILLTAAQEGDAVASEIVDDATMATAKLVKATATRLGYGDDVSIAVAGGIVCSNALYRETVLAKLASLGMKPARVAIVKEPVTGALSMARDLLREGNVA